MSLYIANENGDWWEFNPNDVLYIMRPEDCPVDESPDNDKFESVIMENGTTVEELYSDLIKVLNS
jgi:hypothetical protein